MKAASGSAPERAYQDLVRRLRRWPHLPGSQQVDGGVLILTTSAVEHRQSGSGSRSDAQDCCRPKRNPVVMTLALFDAWRNEDSALTRRLLFGTGVDRATDPLQSNRRRRQFGGGQPRQGGDAGSGHRRSSRPACDTRRGFDRWVDRPGRARGWGRGGLQNRQWGWTPPVFQIFGSACNCVADGRFKALHQLEVRSRHRRLGLGSLTSPPLEFIFEALILDSGDAAEVALVRHLLNGQLNGYGASPKAMFHWSTMLLNERCHCSKNISMMESRVVETRSRI